jgi:hypothetical protein
MLTAISGIISMRFGLTDGQLKTLDEISKQYGLTCERVCSCLQVFYGSFRLDRSRFVKFIDQIDLILKSTSLHSHYLRVGRPAL